MPAIDALVLDYGGVLSFDQDPARIAEMAAMFGVPADQFIEVYWRHRRGYDRGQPVDAYWNQVATDLERPRPPLERLIAIDVASWALYREPMWRLAADFRARGGHTAFLSNNIPELMAFLRRERALEQQFDVVIASCEIGVDKPEPDIFRLCAQRLGLEPARCLFVDDRVPNIESARREGWQTVHFAGDVHAVRQLCIAGS